jgi:probable rRNA maturation factor
MSGTLSVRNRQRARHVNSPLLRRITLCILGEQLFIKDFELGIHLVAAPEMAHVNEAFLNHKGSTDVITFDYAGLSPCLARTGEHPVQRRSVAHVKNNHRLGSRRSLKGCVALHGELFVCLDDAVKQAAQFRTTWQSELVRYVIHGLLHLCGHDDLKPAARRQMKRAENRLLRETARRFDLANLGDRTSKRGTTRSAN